MANLGFENRVRKESSPVLGHILSTVRGMADSLPFSVNGNVVPAPDWYDVKLDHYLGRIAPQVDQLTKEEKFAMLGVFTLIALAIIFRKSV